MADDLDRLVDAIESEGPSPEFVATLRARIVAETEGAVGVVPADDDLIEVRPAAPRRIRRTRWTAIGMVAAAVVVIIGLIVLSRQDERLEPIDEPSVTTAVPNTIAGPPATFIDDAAPIGADEDLLDPGNYRVDALGTPISLTLREPMRGSSERASLFLAHPDVQGIDDRTISFIRLTALSDPAEPIVAPGDATTTWPADDLDGWLAAVSDEIVVTDRVETRLGGAAATRFDLELGVTDCVVGGESCGWFGTNRGVRDQELAPGSRYRIWVVDQGEHDPLAVVAAIDRESDRAWFDAAEAVVSTVAFGELGPNPLLAGDAGPVALPVFGGVTVDVSDGSFVLRDRRGVVRIVLDAWPGETTLVAGVLDAAGVRLESADAVVAALTAGGAELSELEPTVVGGVDARVFDVEAASPAPSLRLATEPDGTLTLPQRGRLWMVEHPDRGLLVIAAGAASNLDIVAPLAIEQATALVGSLTFDAPS